MSSMTCVVSASLPRAAPIRRNCSSHGEKYKGAPFGWAIVGAIAVSFPYDSSSSPALVPMMTSGSRAAMPSKSSPSLLTSTVGSAAPSSSWAHGHVANGWSPYQSVTPAGVTPSARTKSCSVTPTVTTRCGSESTTVVPRACSTVAGNAAALGAVVAGAVVVAVASSSSPPHPAATVAKATNRGAPRRASCIHVNLALHTEFAAIQHRLAWPAMAEVSVDAPFTDTIETVDQLRELYRQPTQVVAEKKLDHIPPWGRALIGAAR